MRKSQAPSAQKNSILNYFSRTPGKDNTAARGGEDVGKVKTPLKAVHNSSPHTPKTPKSANFAADTTPKLTPKSSRKAQLCSTPIEFKSPKTQRLSEKEQGNRLFDIVWAKLAGFPWWPSLICEDPVTNSFEKGPEIHVQFFDDPVTHSWVRKRDIKPFTGSVAPGISVKSSDKKLKLAIEWAEEALDQDREARFKLIGDLKLDDATGNDESSEMQVDDNSEESVEKPKSKTPSKRKKNISIVGAKDSDEENTSDNENISKSTQKKRFRRNRTIESSDEESTKKSDDEEDEYKPPNGDESSGDDDASEVAHSDDDSIIETPVESEDESIEEEKPAKKGRGGNKSTASKHGANTSKAGTSSKSFSMSMSRQTNNTTCNTTSNTTGNVSQAMTHIEAVDRDWPHLHHPFLQPDKIADARRQRMFLTDGEPNPEFNQATLFVPTDFLNKQTPGQRQWWQLKSANFDTILFFKMGKFYELFHMDAVVAAKELQILLMKGDFAHAGFPEKSYKRYADVLIQQGYKVARVEQTETPEMMTARTKGDKSCTKFDKVVRREVCRVSSLGTRYMSDIDSDALNFSNAYLYAFSCKTTPNGLTELGISFVDVSLGKVYLTQFNDDRQNSKLRTLLSHYTPAEIIYSGTADLAKLLDTVFPGIPKQRLGKFWKNSQTLKYIKERGIWAKEKLSTEDILDTLLPDGSDNSVELKCRPEYSLAMYSFGGMIEYLEKALVADDVFSMGQFEVYRPVGSTANQLGKYLVIDSVTMKNLEVLQNLRGEESASLFKIINNCCTPFGKRFLRTMLCLPLCNQRDELQQRQEAVRDLAENIALTPEISGWRSVMTKLPDLERLLTQIHSIGSLKRARDHPDSRAILFEGETYRRRRISNFLATLDGFEAIAKMMRQISAKSDEINSKLLKRLVSNPAEGGIFPDVQSKIDWFRNSFDAEEARKENNVIPRRGADAEYDEALDGIAEVERQLEEYRNEQQQFFKVKVAYVNSGKTRYLMEVVESAHAKTVHSRETYERKNGRKGYLRYHTPKLINLIAKLETAEGKLSFALGDIFRRLLEKFDADYRHWSQAIHCLATLDMLISLSKTKQTFESHDAASCLPKFIWSNNPQETMLRATDLRNACLVDSRHLIANDVHLKNGTMVLTGPNMAGKTTLMRSVGLLVVLAQIGAYVPASECTLTPVDRIFTRIGAYDQVIEAQSTFMVEVNETVTILQNATVHSLVLIDELGRGTSTFDGIAIAQSVLEELTDAIGCRCIFSTHFHSIVDEVQHLPSVSVAHMAFMVENENKADPTEEDVIFLYKLTPGVCSQSYGYNVAKLAGIDREILRNAYKAGHAFELQVESCRLLDAFIQGRLKKETDLTELSEEKFDQLAQFLSEILITRQGGNDMGF